MGPIGLKGSGDMGVKQGSTEWNTQMWVHSYAAELGREPGRDRIGPRRMIY